MFCLDAAIAPAAQPNETADAVGPPPRDAGQVGVLDALALADLRGQCRHEGGAAVIGLVGGQVGQRHGVRGGGFADLGIREHRLGQAGDGVGTGGIGGHRHDRGAADGEPRGQGRALGGVVDADPLGPKGLMPNPKTGTVTPNVAKAVTDIKAGQVAYRIDNQSNLHVLVGKVSFSEQELLENIQAVHEEVIEVRPASVSGSSYIKNLAVASTFGPGVKINHRTLLDKEEA